MNQDEKAIDLRLLAVAINAAREARIVKGRDPTTWSDNDAYIVDNVHQMLRQTQNQKDLSDNEAFPLRDHAALEIEAGAKRISDLLNSPNFEIPVSRKAKEIEK